jgi:hypothetical protein
MSTFMVPAGWSLYNLYQYFILGFTTALRDGKYVALDNNGLLLPESDKIIWVMDNYQTGAASVGTDSYDSNKPGIPDTLQISDLFALYSEQISTPTQDAGLLPTPTSAPAAESPYSPLHLGDAAEVIGNALVFDSTAVIQGLQPATYSDSPVQYGQFVTIANELDANTKTASATLTASIAQCVSDRLASEASINSTISGNAATAASAIASEAAAREAANASLQSQIDSHGAKLDVITASPDILQSFNGVKDFVDQLKTDEQASLTSAVVTLTTSIGNETTRATSAEASLQTSLSALTSSVSSQIASVEAEYDGKFAAVGTTLSKILAFLKSIDQDLYSQYSLAPVASSRVISHAFGLVQGGDVQMYGSAGPSDHNATQIVLLQNGNWSDAGQQNYTGWTIKSDCLPEYTTITGFRFDYSNYSSVFRCVYVDLSAPINSSFNGNNTFVITP